MGRLNWTFVLLLIFFFDFGHKFSFAQELNRDHLIFTYDPAIPPQRKWHPDQVALNDQRQIPEPKATKGFEGLFPRKWLKWSFKLSKEHYARGEIVWGRLVVKNDSPKISFRLSPPGNSRFISTVGIWTNSVEGGSTGDVKESTELNKGNYFNDFFYRGPPLVLAPGEVYEVDIPININQVENQDTFPSVGKNTRTGWSPACQFGAEFESREHKFYLQYVNAEAIGYRSYSSFFSNKIPDKALTSSTPVNFDGYPMVLGPFEFSVDAEGIESGMWANVRDQRVPVLSELRSMHRRNHDSMLRKTRQKSNLRWQYEFLFLKNYSPTYDLEFAPGKKVSQLAKSKKLANLEAVLSHLDSKDPLVDYVQIERCETLNLLGYPLEAIRLAKQIKSPDSGVFLDLMEFDQSKFSHLDLDKAIEVTAKIETKDITFVRVKLSEAGRVPWEAELEVMDSHSALVAKSRIQPWAGGDATESRSTIFGFRIASRYMANSKVFFFHPSTNRRVELELKQHQPDKISEVGL